MQYFDEADDKFERIGKVIGDVCAVAVYVSLAAFFAA
jgi:hypothetical protein